MSNFPAALLLPSKDTFISDTYNQVPKDPTGRARCHNCQADELGMASMRHLHGTCYHMICLDCLSAWIFDVAGNNISKCCQRRLFVAPSTPLGQTFSRTWQILAVRSEFGTAKFRWGSDQQSHRDVIAVASRPLLPQLEFQAIFCAVAPNWAKITGFLDGNVPYPTSPSFYIDWKAMRPVVLGMFYLLKRVVDSPYGVGLTPADNKTVIGATTALFVIMNELNGRRIDGMDGTWQVKFLLDVLMNLIITLAGEAHMARQAPANTGDAGVPIILD